MILVFGSVQTLQGLDTEVWKFIGDCLRPRVDKGPLRDTGSDSLLPNLLPAEVGIVFSNCLPVAGQVLVQLLKVGEYLRHLVAEVVIRKHKHACLEADELGIGLARNVRILC